MKQSASHSISRLYSIQYFFFEQRKKYLRKQSRTQTHKPSTNKTNKIRCTTKKKTNAQIYSTKLHPFWVQLSTVNLGVCFFAISIKIFFWSVIKTLLYFCTGSTQDTFLSYSDGFILLYDYDKSQVSSVFLGKQKRISVQEIGLSINRQRLLLIPRMLVFYCCSSHKWITDISQFDLKLSL